MTAPPSFDIQVLDYLGFPVTSEDSPLSFWGQSSLSTSSNPHNLGNTYVVLLSALRQATGVFSSTATTKLGSSPEMWEIGKGSARSEQLRISTTEMNTWPPKEALPLVPLVDALTSPAPATNRVLLIELFFKIRPPGDTQSLWSRRRMINENNAASPSFRTEEASSQFPRTSPPEDVLCRDIVVPGLRIVKQNIPGE